MRRLTVYYGLIICCACSPERVQVKYVPEPDYPLQALIRNIEGTVLVTACFGVDGKVASVAGTGGNP